MANSTDRLRLVVVLALVLIIGILGLVLCGTLCLLTIVHVHAASLGLAIDKSTGEAG